jgi:uncharacterized protein YutE (UPF0331/DUF86 family)
VQRAFAERLLQTAIQAVLDVASAIVTEERLPEPVRNTQLFERMRDAGWLTAEQAETCRKMAGFRNVVVHAHLDVDPEIVRDVLEHRLDDLLDFVRAVRDRLGRRA